MAKKQQFGIKYPFRREDIKNYYVDTNSSTAEKARSQIMHIIFTPKGQRIRNPEFGSDLIKYIFDTNDEATWESIKNEVKESVSRWANNIMLNDLQVVKNEEDDSEIFVKIAYSVKEGNKVTNDSVVVQI